MVKKVAQCNSLVASTPRVGPIKLPDPRVQAIDNKIVAMTDMIEILRRQREKLTGQKQKSTINNSAEYKYTVMLVGQEIENELLIKLTRLESNARNWAKSNVPLLPVVLFKICARSFCFFRARSRNRSGFPFLR